MEITRYEDGSTGRTVLLESMLLYHLGRLIEIDAWISHIIDHKGSLEVYWYRMPTEELKKILEDAWEYLGECSVCHYILTKGEFKEIE